MQPVLHALRLCGWPARTVPCAGGAAGHRDGARALQHGRLRAAVPGVAEGHGAAQARLPAVLDAGAAARPWPSPAPALPQHTGSRRHRKRARPRRLARRPRARRAAARSRAPPGALSQRGPAGKRRRWRASPRTFDPSALLRGSCVSRGSLYIPDPRPTPARAGRRAGAGERAGPGHAGAPAALPGAPARLPARPARRGPRAGRQGAAGAVPVGGASALFAALLASLDLLAKALGVRGVQPRQKTLRRGNLTLAPNPGAKPCDRTCCWRCRRRRATWTWAA